MRFWLREVFGWLLVLLGLVVFVLCYELLMSHHLVEAGALSFIGFIIYRGGIHLLKVAAAAHVCKETQDKVLRNRPAEGKVGLGNAKSRNSTTHRPNFK